MTIAVDARELGMRPTGVGRYLSRLLEAWSHSPIALRHQWRCFAHQSVPVPPVWSDRVTVIPGNGGTAWEQWSLPRALSRQRPDVLFAPGYTAPLTAPCPVVLTVHDVSFAAHPEWFSRREGTRRRTLSAWSSRRAAVVLTDSSFSQAEIVRRLGIPPTKVRVVPLGADAHAAVTTPVTREPLILYVGSIFARRHVDRLVEAFVRFVAPQINSRLEIVGEARFGDGVRPADWLRGVEPSLAERVAFRSYVTDSALRDLYARATVFAFLSEYEGFGLTPLEALAAGVTPLVLDTPVAREIYGPAARYVTDVTDTRAIGEALVELLTSGAARQRVLDHAPAVLQRYDWQRSADLTLSAIVEAGGG